MELLKKYNQIFCETFDVDEAELNDSFDNESIEKWDSIGHMNLISEIEEEFDIMLDGEDIMDFQSYKKGIEILKKYDINIEG